MSGAPTLFERLALSQISSDLGGSQDERQTPIDRVCALGFAPRLGSYLIRIKGGNDHASYNDAVDLISWRLEQLSRRNNWGHGERMRRIAAAALDHYILDMCKVCGGRGEIPKAYSITESRADEAGEVCSTCAGGGKAARNDQERIAAVFRPGDIAARLAEILDAADGIIDRAARLATGISRTKLYGDN